ncbi:MAG TPA: hypothetical protein VFL86_05880 [Burkholderiaceae bacterium]|nr:hypothetical protein [Burkholderiaceae bacterium]
MTITTESLAPQAHKVLASGRRAGADAWDRMATQGSEWREGAVSVATRAADRTRGYVEDRPLRALLMAAAAGAVAALLAEWLARDRDRTWR